jgi:DNA-binding transcriptional ArsR family regulator
MSDQTEALLSALGSHEMLALVVRLLEENRLTVTELATSTGIPQPTVSRHLVHLAAIGLTKREGAHAPYTLRAPDAVRQVLEAASGLSVHLLKERLREEEALKKRLARTRMTDASSSGQSA